MATPFPGELCECHELTGDGIDDLKSKFRTRASPQGATTAFAVDRVSGVTLDALGCGCPVIATAGTWMAKVVERFDAGVVIADRSAPAVAEVVGRIVNDYAAYHRRALEGGRVLRQEHDARHLLKIVMSDE